MSPRDWLIERINKAHRIHDEFQERLRSNDNQTDPWELIEETQVRRPPRTSLTCANTNSHIIPTLSLLPFYDKIYFHYSGRNWNKPDVPPLTNSIVAIASVRILHLVVAIAIMQAKSCYHLI